MKKVFTVLLFLIPVWAEADSGVTLDEAYRSALAHMETVKISAADISAAKGRFNQALGTVLPQISFKASEQIQDTSGTGSGGSDVGGTFTRKYRPEAAFSVTQNLFQGIKAVSGLKAAGADKARYRFLYQDALRLLFNDVATAFFTVAKIQKEIQTQEEMLSVLKTRVDDVKKWVQIGKSRKSELLAQETELSLLSAEQEGAKGDLEVAYEILSFISGLNEKPPVAVEPVSDLEPISFYLDLAHHRPDLMAAKKNVDVAKGTLGVYASGLAPMVDVTGNYYVYRVGFQKEINWDALFTLKFPLFNLGTAGQIQEEKARLKQVEWEAEKSNREVDSQVKQAYAKAAASLRQFKAYSRAASQARASYQSEIEDYRLGLLNNLEVLQSERTWLNAANLKNEADIQAHLDAVQLKVAGGVWP